jgi:hypothetical protein
MVEPTINPWNIWNIGANPLDNTLIQNQKNKKIEVAMFDNAPSDVTLWSLFGKLAIWVAVGLCIVALLFWTLAAIKWLTYKDSDNANSTLKILLSVVGFIVQLVWSSTLALMFNIFFSKRYYNLWKMLWLIFVSSIIFFIFFLIMYALYDRIMELYVLLWFQVIFWLYITLNLIDFLSQPNYSASSLLWNTLWCVLTVVLYLIFNRGWQLPSIYVALISVILSYTLMILWSEIWNAIYYKLFEWWNNPFYLPSLNELREERKKEEAKKAENNEDVNVDMR